MIRTRPPSRKRGRAHGRGAATLNIAILAAITLSCSSTSLVKIDDSFAADIIASVATQSADQPTWGPPTAAFKLKADILETTTLKYRFSPLQVAADREGNIHVFWSLPGLPTQIEDGPRIEHLIMTEGVWQKLQPIGARRNHVPEMKTHAGEDGKIYLLWPETAMYGEAGIEASHGIAPVLYLYTSEGNEEGTVQLAIEPSLYLSLHNSEQLDLSVSPEGVVDIFWIDWREVNAFHDIATMGHAGNMPKAFHRRRLAAGWSDIEKVQ